jgi:hypothetical protein
MLRQRNIFHKGNWRETPGGIESGTCDEQRLITCGNAGQARAQVHHGSDQRKQPTRIKAYVKASPDAAGARKAIKKEGVRIIRKTGIRVQEQKNLAKRNRATGIHLHCATARCDANVIGKRTGAGRRGIAAPSVHDDHFSATRLIRLQRRQCFLDICGLVQHRHDDRQSRAAHSAASFKAPPQLEPWPAVQP